MIDTTKAVISIHALREEGDAPLTAPSMLPIEISIHALREEGDLKYRIDTLSESLFLSTPSARRATDAKTAGVPVFIFLSTPSARRATDADQEELRRYRISIHALREEGDSKNRDKISIFL